MITTGKKFSEKFAPQPPPSVLDRKGVDRLLAALIAKHHEPRYDIAPQIRAAARAARHVEAASEMVPVS
jgi:hypothetical protein